MVFTAQKKKSKGNLGFSEIPNDKSMAKYTDISAKGLNSVQLQTL